MWDILFYFILFLKNVFFITGLNFSCKHIHPISNIYTYIYSSQTEIILHDRESHKIKKALHAW